MNRRQCLAALSALPLALPALARAAADAPRRRPLRIERIELFPVRYPMTGYFKFFAGPAGEAGRAAVIIKMTAADGTIGWGESVPLPTWSDETLETAVVALRHYFVPALLGLDAMDLAGAHRRLDAALAPAFSTGMPITRAGLDLALHDLAGRATGQPVHRMWGRPRGGPLTLSWTVNARTLDEVEPLVAAGRQRGYRHFNIKVAPDLDFDVALARSVRRLAPDCFLWADANCGYDLATALRAAPRLAEAGADVLEAPIRPNLLSGYQALKRQAALPIYMDEGVVSPAELGEFIRLGMLDGVAQKPSRCGGLFSCRRQIELLHEAGLSFLGSGLTDPDISLAATVALYAAYGLKKPAALNGPQFLAASVLKKPLVVNGGMLAVPDGPGLGIEVDEAKVRDLAARLDKSFAR